MSLPNARCTHVSRRGRTGTLVGLLLAIVAGVLSVSATPALANGRWGFLSSTRDAPDAVRGMAYQYTYQAQLVNAPSFAIQNGALPPGLHLDSGGTVSGTPTTNGTYGFTVRASDDLGYAVALDDLITVAEPQGPYITSPNPPSATLNVAYAFTVAAHAWPPATFSVVAGALPAGLSLQPGGLLSGVPTKLGCSTFTVQADNGVSIPPRSNYQICVTTPPVITSGPPPPTSRVGAAYNFQLTATSAIALTWSVVSGSLPPGVSLIPSFGVLNGVTAVAGSFTFTIRATSAWGSNQATYTITVT